MNDEEFARAVFARSLETSFRDEPALLPSVDRIAAEGRRTARNRHGLQAGGTVVLAGAVTAALVSGPSFLGLGSSAGSPTLSGTDGSAGAAGDTSQSGVEVTSAASKPGPGVPCTPGPTVDWAGILAAALPGVGLTASQAPTCVQEPDATTLLEATYTIDGGALLQIDAHIGASAVKTAPPGPKDSGQAAGGAASAVTKVPASFAATSPPSADVQRKLAASAAASAAASRASGSGSCSDSAVTNETVCGGEFAKGPYSGMEADISGKSLPGVVQVIVTAPQPSTATPSPSVPVTATQLKALAQDVYDALVASAAS